MVFDRRERDQLWHFPIFGEPAWDMLLDLAIAHRTGATISVSSLCIAAGVPATTALRWINTLIELGMIERVDDTQDRRRTLVRLTDDALATMDTYLDRVQRAPSGSGR